jgi:hypothetical protein
VVGNGHSTRFWEDSWLGQRSLANEYMSLYNIVKHRNVTVENVLSSTPINIGFRRILDGNRWDIWTHLLDRLILLQLTDCDDSFKWSLASPYLFIVKSMYIDLLSGLTMYFEKYIWKMKVPLKIRIFIWFLHKKVILTKDNLVKRNWHGDVRCCFCDQEATIQHLFISCIFKRMIWTIIYMTFNRPPFKYYKCVWKLVEWGAQKDKAHIRVGVCAVLWTI